MSSDSIEWGVSHHGFMSQGTCYAWQPDILGLQAIADGLITLAYGSILVTLLYFLHKRTDLRFNWMFPCFAIFMIACAAMHLMEIWTIWHPTYWLSGAIKAIAALALVTTSVFLIKLVPDGLRLPCPAALQIVNSSLEREIAERVRAEEDLRGVNESLEGRVAERTAQLEALNRILLQDNARIAIAADAAGLGFWNWEVASNAVQWDERMYRLYGRPPMEGPQPYALWLDSLHPDDRQRCHQESTDALKGKNAYDSEFRTVHPNGAIRHIRGAARITRDAHRNAIRMFGVNFDITDLKRANEKFRLAMEAAPTGMLLMSVTGSIVLVNAQIERLFGYPRSELLNRQIEMLVPERFRGHHPDYRIGFFGAPRTRPMGAGRELYGLRKDGSEVPIEIGLNPLQTSEGDFVLSSIVDLSQRREIERMRVNFVSAVSHELRTPLTSIAGSLGLLQSGVVGELPEKAAAMVQIAYKNSERLVRIINDILDIGKLEAGEMTLHLASTPVGDLLQQSVEANSAYAERYGVRFVLDDGSVNERVTADPDRLMQVMTNLLSNAAKFSPPGADVFVRVRSDSNTLRIEVEDSGSGVPEAFRDRIFEKFAQADASATRRFEGTGLGLSITRELVEAMGGKIDFSSVVGKGTIFYIELPRADVAPRRWIPAP